MGHLTQALSVTLAASTAMAWPWPGHKPHDVLQWGSPQSVGMDPKPLEQAKTNLSAYTHPAYYGYYSNYSVHPIQPGGTTIVGHKNTIVSAFVFGKQDLYADVNGTLLPEHLQEDATMDTIYDMASLTKMYTTVAALRQLDAGKIALNETVKTYVPGFEVNGKHNITIEMLVTHTSGFAPDPNPPLYYPQYKTYESRIEAIITQGLQNPPGSTYLYSDLNFMSLMLVLENVTGQKLDELIYEYTSLLGLKSTFFNRGNDQSTHYPPYPRMATQEFQIAVLGPLEPQRPQPVRGTVHDENAWALDGVSGHAGLFSTVADSAAFCQMILNNGTYNGHRILSQAAVDLIFTNLNARFHNINDDHGFGFELDQYYTAGPLASLQTASHTGFTGTSMVIDRARDVFYLHFANRVHPSRYWSSNNIVREALGYWVAKSLGLNPAFPEL